MKKIAVAAGIWRDVKIDSGLNFCAVMYKLLFFFAEPWDQPAFV